jgi:DNA-binding CsgD family transcriptional regulator
MRYEYALYKGDELLAIGTVREIADQVGVTEKTVIHYGTPTYKKRTSENARRLVRLEKTE